MISNSRPLTELEQETWAAYEYALDQVKGVRSYDRVSVHEAFPDIKAAFEKCQAMNTYYHLTKDHNAEE